MLNEVSYTRRYTKDCRGLVDLVVVDEQGKVALVPKATIVFFRADGDITVEVKAWDVYGSWSVKGIRKILEVRTTDSVAFGIPTWRQAHASATALRILADQAEWLENL